MKLGDRLKETRFHWIITNEIKYRGTNSMEEEEGDPSQSKKVIKQPGGLSRAHLLRQVISSVNFEKKIVFE